MILAVAATEFEMQALLSRMPGQGNCTTLISGVGPMETAVRLSVFLARHHQDYDLVLNFGVAGVYVYPEQKKSIALLDVCLAEKELFGDFGICLADKVEHFSAELSGEREFILDQDYLERASRILATDEVLCHRGTFVTVNSVTATAERAGNLARQYQGLCENMEGYAVARVCREFSLSCVEVRVISNLVEQRNRENWKLQEACEKAGAVAARLVTGL